MSKPKTLRDEFAIAALPQATMRVAHPAADEADLPAQLEEWRRNVAYLAYRMADALMAERDQPGPAEQVTP